MKRIILTIAVTLAIGGAASGQTVEEVKEIIEAAKKIGLAEISDCRKSKGFMGKPFVKADWKSIGDEIRSHYRRMLRGATITDSQLYEAVCIRMFRIELAQKAENLEAGDRQCMNALARQTASIFTAADKKRLQTEIPEQAKEAKKNYASIFSEITDPQLEEALCQMYVELHAGATGR